MRPVTTTHHLLACLILILLAFTVSDGSCTPKSKTPHTKSRRGKETKERNPPSNCQHHTTDRDRPLQGLENSSSVHINSLAILRDRCCSTLHSEGKGASLGRLAEVPKENRETHVQVPCSLRCVRISLIFPAGHIFKTARMGLWN